MVVVRGVKLALAGIGLGLAGAVVATRALDTLLFQTSTRDPLALVAAPLLLGAAAVMASYVPARRAARVPPIIALSR
jgi:hypothetical protein